MRQGVVCLSRAGALSLCGWFPDWGVGWRRSLCALIWASPAIARRIISVTKYGAAVIDFNSLMGFGRFVDQQRPMRPGRIRKAAMFRSAVALASLNVRRSTLRSISSVSGERRGGLERNWPVGWGSRVRQVEGKRHCWGRRVRRRARCGVEAVEEQGWRGRFLCGSGYLGC